MEVFHDTAIRSVTCHMGHGITQCIPSTRHNWTHPALTPAIQAATRFTYPRGMEGWVDLVVFLFEKNVDAQKRYYLSMWLTNREITVAFILIFHTFDKVCQSTQSCSLSHFRRVESKQLPSTQPCSLSLVRRVAARRDSGATSLLTSKLPVSVIVK